MPEEAKMPAVYDTWSEKDVVVEVDVALYNISLGCLRR